jgi:hypothetical protein
VRVWFDEWVIKPGDDVYLAIERGLQETRTQLLCLSSAALQSNWVELERSTVIFRDPSNVNRRFIPVLLEDCDLPDGLKRYRYVDLRGESNAAFEQLVSACDAIPKAKKPPRSSVKRTNSGLRNRSGSKLFKPSITTGNELPPVRTFGLYESAPYDRLVGRKNDVASIVQTLRANDSAPIVTIKAMGGMGKTALAHAVVEQCLQQRVFEAYIWVSTQTDRFVEERRVQIGVSDFQFEELLNRIALGVGRNDIAQSGDIDTKTAAIRDALRSRRTLIVLDRLDAVPQRDQFVDRLYQIIGIGKILVTCRYRIMHNRITVYELPGLLGADGLEFLQMQIKQRKLVDTIDLQTTEIEAIVKETGGSPLTMSVIAGQLQYHRSVDDILMNLRSVRAPDDVLYEEMYKYMFRASLLQLGVTGQNVLISMAYLVPAIGAEEADIVALNREIEPTVVKELLKKLYNLSLVILQRGARGGPRYALHPLTHNVLHSELAYVTDE